MSQFRTIEIDFDVHKRIELERANFAESPNEVLRRILGISQNSEVKSIDKPRKSWASDGTVLPHGTELRMIYNGIEYYGVIDDGMWLVDGEEYNSPSGAAGAVARTKRGKPTPLNGWKYWFVKKPGTNNWIALWDLWTKDIKPKRIQA
jgi:hypothetical protein